MTDRYLMELPIGEKRATRRYHIADPDVCREAHKRLSLRFLHSEPPGQVVLTRDEFETLLVLANGYMGLAGESLDFGERCVQKLRDVWAARELRGSTQIEKPPPTEASGD